MKYGTPIKLMDINKLKLQMTNAELFLMDEIVTESSSR